MFAGHEQREEVDDVDSILKTWTYMPATGLASNVAAYVAEERALTAPNPATQGTAVPFAGTPAVHRSALHLSAVQPAAVRHTEVAFAGARSTDLLGPVPRGAPV